MPNEADAVRQLAAKFLEMSEGVDDFRQQHLSQLTLDESARLEEYVQQLDDIHDRLTAIAIEQTLNAIRGDLDRIVRVTTQASAALKHLNSVAKIVKVISAAAELGEAIATSDFGAIPSSIQDIVQALSQTADKNSSDTDASTLSPPGSASERPL